MFVAVLLGIPAFGVHQPVGGQALEERVQVLVVRADPARAEAHAQEQAVHSVGLVAGDQLLDQRAGDGELVAAPLPGEGPDLADREVDDDRAVVAGPQQHGAADAGPDVPGQLQERLEPGLQRGGHIGAAGGPGALGGLPPVVVRAW